MAQGRQGQAGLGQSQGASLCLVLGLPSPPQVQREQGEGAGIDPVGPTSSHLSVSFGRQEVSSAFLPSCSLGRRAQQPPVARDPGPGSAAL